MDKIFEPYFTTKPFGTGPGPHDRVQDRQGALRGHLRHLAGSGRERPSPSPCRFRRRRRSSSTTRGMPCEAHDPGGRRREEHPRGAPRGPRAGRVRGGHRRRRPGGAGRGRPRGRRPAHHGPEDAAALRGGAPEERDRAVPDHARHHPHRPRHHRVRRPGHARRRVRLPHEAGQPGPPVPPGEAGPGQPRAGRAEPRHAGGAGAAERVCQHHRPQRRDEAGLRDGPPGGPVPQLRADHRGERRRERR